MKTAIQTLLPLLKLYRWRIALVFTSVIVVTGAGLLAPWLIRELVRVLRLADGDVEATQQSILVLSGLLLLAYGVRSLGQYLNFYYARVVAWNVCHDLRTVLYQQLQRFSPAYYAERQTGEVVSRVIKDTDYLEPIIVDAVYDFLVSVFLAVGVFVILLLIDPTLTLITFLPMPFVVIAILILRRPAVRVFKAEAKDMGEVSALVQDNVAGIREIQIFTREGHELERVSRLSRQLTRNQIRARQYVAGMLPLIEGSIGLSMVLAIGFGGLAVLNGTLAIEDLVAFLLYVTSFYLPLWRLATVSEQLERGVASLGRINEVLSATPSVDDPADGVELGRAQGSLTLEKVSFAYLEEDVLRDVTLNVSPGKTLALVGPNGAGKSTLASLLSRFYDPLAGQILLDGHDLRDLRLDSLRRNLSVVLQDVFLFYASVAENIRFARPEATDDEVIAAAKVANAHDFIMQLSKGYDTLVGERGVKLSGGQKQRISIARAVLKDAPILILDEATSSVDIETEAQIQQALTKLMEGRTSVVIAHRLSTIRNADQIAVLDEGRVVELGRHEEIAHQNGLYARLLARQMIGY
ncbi:MAG: ABC transporter ATP-binding protein [Chloroflexi bacterium AL-W]|nr:ABC transporter ATP-binding protein [Chloroflexi bacterium AL-N1]NOK70751.1 ABC transporter ATP-binding protein [Chloroflexi bacterium AL-N10]NOK78311.1 ABC transporter ATP-binding protein [Chloroflexi bacterium AL-N5]NOK85654.1 ABC transporter ATP-binding protein [Chloroflexi bacterium AL-W]NOK92568.1 ABC transporter ATP-binding protein [Chloroflexi bacterium AL-N15]